MNIVEINGGLGNQIMQYTFSRYIEIVNKKTDILHDDIDFFSNNTHNGFELEKIFPNIKLNLLSKKFDDDVWEYMHELYHTSNFTTRTPNILLQNGIDIALVVDEYFHDGKKLKNNYTFDGRYHFVLSTRWHTNLKIHKKVREELENEENIHYAGCWINPALGIAIKDVITHELQFPELQDQQNIDYRDAISSSDISVGLHVRRGDFIQYNKVIPNENYSKEVRNLKRELAKTSSKKVNFFLFSDDLNWCKENKRELGFNENDNITFIEGNNVDARNYIDMQLMTFCDYLIHDEASSFAQAAKIISTKPIELKPCYNPSHSPFLRTNV